MPVFMAGFYLIQTHHVNAKIMYSLLKLRFRYFISLTAIPAVRNQPFVIFIINRYPSLNLTYAAGWAEVAGVCEESIS